MKIFYICFENFGKSDNAATKARELAENLVSLGNEVHIFAPLFRRFRFPVRVDVTYIPLLPLGKFKELGYYIFLWFALLRWWIKKGVDIIYVREMALNIAPYLFAKIFRKKIVVEINSMISDELLLSGISYWKLKLIKISRRLNLALSDKIVTINRAIRHSLVNEYGCKNGKLTIVENGTNPHIFVPIDKIKARQMLGFAENEFIICYECDFYVYHGLEQSLVIFKHLLQYQPNTKLLLISEGIQRERIMHFVNKLELQRNVVHYARAFQMELPKYIGASDACLLLFNRDIGRTPGLSLKTFEYMSCARPVIAAKGEESGWLIQELNSGIVVQPGNPQKAAVYIATLLNNEPLKQKLGSLGRSAVLNNYTWKHTAQKLAKVYSELL